ncbi:MAG: hypothetical protein A3J28_06420 [Acidobacteria bacterium RIFCSPLOWO2_12_FULL_60_22]|nr:MAG: hypothetical protein A3J28_06420 [Acidobacteria bacterium RIFCSPLOWO2_12_FULL_60_22]
MLVAIQPLPEDGEMCPLISTSAESSLFASMLQERSSREAMPSDSARAEVTRRKPVRMIRDPYLAYSAVAVDVAHNEVVMADENLFSIVAYNRLENTPAAAKMSEPKRMIQGMNTELEFECSLYVDPENGDIYAVNNDTLGKLVVFSRQARGDAAPDRSLDTPMGTYGIAIDEKNQEMMLTVQNDAAVVSFRKGAKGQDSPLRTLQGPQTLLADPHGIALDPGAGLLFVSNWGSVNEHRKPASGPVLGSLGRGVGRSNWPIGMPHAVPGSGKFMPPSITVYARSSSGDTAPLRVIQGPKTQLNWPTALAFDPERGELYVANDPADSVLVFKADASGDVAPIRVLRGPKTQIKNPTSVNLDLKNDELWVANFGNHTATVYKRSANGDTPPLRVIRSAPIGAPTPMMGNPNVLAYDSKREELLVAN